MLYSNVVDYNIRFKYIAHYAGIVLILVVVVWLVWSQR